jgi:putative phosphonoacetaldehyde dehydrogenase
MTTQTLERPTAKVEVEHVKCFVAGEWIDSTQRAEVRNPYNNQLVGTVPVLSAKQVADAIDAMAAYRPKITAHQRSEVLYKAAQGVKARKQEIAMGITLDSGMSLKNSSVEVDRTVGLLLTAAEEAKRVMGEQIPSDTDSAGRDRMILAMRFPVGLVTAIVPFNRPLNQVTVKIAPSFAAGNKTIIKPSAYVPLSSFRLLKILLESGMPPEMISIVTGKSSELGETLVANKKVDMVTFTGSTAVGQKLTQMAGIKRVTIEAGGNDPLILCEDADIDKAVTVALAGAYGNAGQACRGIKRIIAVESVADAFVKKFTEKSKALKCGNPFDPETDIGTLIDERAAIEVERAVNDALKGGAQVLCGHQRSGALYPPTVVDHVQPDMNMVVEECFGPTAPVIRCKNVQEAVEISNSTEYGLQSGVMTSNIETIRYCVNNLKVGAVNINEGPQFDMPNIPFGGVKQSGIGREGIRYAIQEMTYLKTVVL